MASGSESAPDMEADAEVAAPDPETEGAGRQAVALHHSQTTCLDEDLLNGDYVLSNKLTMERLRIPCQTGEVMAIVFQDDGGAIVGSSLNPTQPQVVDSLLRKELYMFEDTQELVVRWRHGDRPGATTVHLTDFTRLYDSCVLKLRVGLTRAIGTVTCARMECPRLSVALFWSLHDVYTIAGFKSCQDRGSGVPKRF